MPAFAASAQGGEIGLHAQLQAADVGFGHLRLHGHGVEVGDAQDDRCLLVGVESLTLACGDRHHGAAHRRQDAGVLQVGLVGAQGGFDLLDLGAERLELGGGREGVRFSCLQAFAGGGVGRHQRLLAAQLDAGERELGFTVLD